MLHGNLIECNSGSYAAFFDEFPEIIAEGDTESETKERLVRGLLKILSEKRQKENTFTIGEKKVSHFQLTAAF
jgi:predicted RNase H-like HicB family nuclease